MKLSKPIVIAYHAHMCAKFGAVAVPHNEILERLPGYDELNFYLQGLELMGIQNPLEWLEEWSIALGRYISISWTPGEGSQRELVSQCGELAHELGHVLQWCRIDNFAYNYVTSKTFRSHNEFEAEMSRQETQFAINRTIPSSTAFAAKLAGPYMCREADAAVNKKKLDMHAKIVRMGGIYTEIGKESAKFFKKFA